MTTQEISSFPHWELKVKTHHSCCRGFTKSRISSFCFKNMFFSSQSRCCSCSFRQSLPYGWFAIFSHFPLKKKNLELSTPQALVFETLKVKVKYIKAPGTALQKPRSRILHFYMEGSLCSPTAFWVPAEIYQNLPETYCIHNTVSTSVLMGGT